MPETRFVVVSSMRLRILDTGAPADPTGLPLLVIPGHTARIDGFADLLAALDGGRRVVVVDLPGCGESDRPVRRYDLTFYEDTLIGVLDELGIDRAIPVGGSLGGNLVLRLGHRFPRRFPELVLWAPGGAWRARPRFGRFVSRLGRWAFWPSVRVQSRFWYDRSFPGREQALAETFAYYRDVMGPGFVRMYWGIAGDQLAHSLFDIAPAITQRTLLMWGDHDNGAGMGAGVARLHELLPNNEFVVFPGARHSIETEIPGQVASTIDRFLAESPSSSR